MPTRRIFELVIVGAILVHPAMGLLRMWAQKELATGKQSGFKNGAAKIVVVVA